MVSQHLDICGGHWSSANGDVKYLTRHVTSQDYAIGGSCDFICYQTAKFGGHKHCGSGDKSVQFVK